MLNDLPTLNNGGIVLFAVIVMVFILVAIAAKSQH